MFFIYFQLKSYARTQLASAGLASITDLGTLSKILPGITKTDLITIPDASKVDTIVNIVNASLVNGIAMTSNQVNILESCRFFFLLIN